MQATAFQVWGEHLEMFFRGSSNPGRLSSCCRCHNATSFLAASSDSAVHDRNSSVGLLLKLVQKLRPSHPSSQGSSTEARQGPSTKFSYIFHASAYLHQCNFSIFLPTFESNIYCRIRPRASPNLS